MDLVILLYQVTGPKTDLESLFKGKCDKLVICSPESAKLFPADLTSSLFITDKIQQVLFQQIEKNYPHYENIYVETIDESCLKIAARAREYYQLQGINEEALLPFTNKIVMKNALQESGLRLPKYHAFDKRRYLEEGVLYLQQITLDIDFPIFVKPIDAYGSINAQRIDTEAELISWANKIKYDDMSYEVDEFIEGDIYHCDCLIQNGEIIFFAVGRMNIPLAQFAKGKALGSIPVAPHTWEFTQLEEYNRDVLNALNPPDGATHLECFITPKEEIIFLEIAARPVGGLVMQQYLYCYGVDFEKAYYEIQIGWPTQIKAHAAADYMAWLYVPQKLGTITALNSPQNKIKSHCDIKWLCKVGENHQQGKDVTSQHIAAVVLLFHQDYATISQDFENLTCFQFIESAYLHDNIVHLEFTELKEQYET